MGAAIGAIGAVSGFIGRIVGGALLMGAIGLAQQYLSSQMKDVGKVISGLIQQMYRSFRNK